MANKDNGTVILPCSCTNAYQDQKYGKGNRVHNIGPKIKESNQARCTGCGRTR